MDAVALVQIAVPGDVLQQKRNEEDALLQRDVAERLAERRGILLTVVRRRLHPGEDHDDAAVLGALDDAREVLLHLGDRQPAQPVVRPEGDDQDADLTLERPVQPSEATG